MKKKLLSLMLVLIMSLTVGCTNSKDEVEEVKERFSMSEKGDCNFYIKTSEILTSKNGAIPYIYAEEDLQLTQIGYEATGFDSSKITYMYIDGKLTSKETFSDDCEGTITLDDSYLTCTKHKIEIVQYKDTESENEEDIEVYKVAQYVVTNDDAEFTKGNEECKKQMKSKSNEDKEDTDIKVEEDDAPNQGVVYKSDNSNKTSRKSSSSKSNTSSKKSENKNESNENYDDSKISCPNCGRKISTNNNIEINCPYCGYYHNSNADEEEIYDDNYGGEETPSDDSDNGDQQSYDYNADSNEE